MLYFLNYLIDIIFDPDLMPDLVITLKFIWSNQNSSRANLSFIVASTIRNTETYQTFLNELGKK